MHIAHIESNARLMTRQPSESLTPLYPNNTCTSENKERACILSLPPLQKSSKQLPFFMLSLLIWMLCNKTTVVSNKLL